MSDNEHQVHLSHGEPDDTKITAAGGWCAPSETLYGDFPHLSVVRGGMHYPTPEEAARAKAEQAAYRHRTRWTRRRGRAKSWLLLRPIRWRIHDHIHRNCE